MTENDLCRELADALFLRCNGDDSWSQTARKKLLPIIRSYINSLASANETQLRRDILIAVNKLVPPTFANDVSVPIESVIDSALLLIRSYANALVAAAVNECAKHLIVDIHHFDSEEVLLVCTCGYSTHRCKEPELEFSEHIRSIVIPESAAKELECQNHLAIQEGWQQCLRSVLSSLKMYPNGGGDIEIMQEVERIKTEAIEQNRDSYDSV